MDQRDLVQQLVRQLETAARAALSARDAAAAEAREGATPDEKREDARAAHQLQSFGRASQGRAKQALADAQAKIKPVTGLGNDVLLDLYALYKQATSGDVSGSRPGMLDVKGRAKYDAWAKRKGLTKDAAMQQYVALVGKHAR